MSSSDSVAQALAGAGGGALAMITTYPLITLSTRAQTERRKSVSADSSSAAATVDLPDSSKSAVEAARKRLAALKKKPSIVAAASKIIQREGVSGLYSGLQSALFGISVTNFVYYYFYEGTRSVFERRKALKSGAAAAAISQSMSTLESMLAGAIAGSATVILTNPIWVVNTRETARVGSAPKQSTFAIIRDILENDGPGAFFAGLMPALVLVINPILQYTIFERLRAVIERKRALRPFDFFILGALGKLVATSTTYPYITVKARMQVQRRRAAAAAEAATSSEEAAAVDAAPVYTSTVSALKQIASTEGWRSLYSGIDSKIVQSVLTSAFLFYFKEQLVVAAVAFLQLARRKRLAAN